MIKKKNLLIILLIVILLICIGFVISSYYFKNIDNNNEIIYSFEADYQNSKFLFYKNEELIREFEGNYRHTDYGIPTIFDKEKGKILLYGKYTEGGYFDSILLYDIGNGTYIEWKNICYVLVLYKNKNGDVNNYNIALVDMNKEIQIITIDGEIIRKFSGKEIVVDDYEVMIANENYYNVEDDMIITKKNNKYGLEKISNEQIILDYVYDDMQFEENYIKIKEDNKWYLYDINSDKRITINSYDRLYVLEENIILVLEDKNISVKDFNNNLVSNDKIILKKGLVSNPPHPRWGEGIVIKKYDNKYEMSIVDGEEDFEFVYYIFDSETKKIIKKEDN